MMPVVKKTIAFHPIMDGWVRRLYAVLGEKGYRLEPVSILN
jgi:hypothetical protein